MSSPASFYIPSVYANITPAMIKKTFARMKIGKVSHVEFVEQKRRDGKPAHKKAYVYFEHLYEMSGILDEVQKEGSARVYYANTPHVYWVLLENTRKLNPSQQSRVCDVEEGEIVDDFETVSLEQQPFTEEEQAFVPEEDWSMVHSDYAYALEEQLAQLRCVNQQLQQNAQTMFTYYNQAIVANNHLQDVQDKWTSLIVDNQMDRLRSIVIRGENTRACPGSDYTDGCGVKLDFDNEVCDECLLERKHQNTEDMKEVSVEI